MVSKVQIKRTSTANSPPADGSLQPGELAVEMADPLRLWVGVPTGIDATGKRLLVPLAAAPPASAFPSGTFMLFQQTAAPTGWTKQSTHDDAGLRVTSGTCGAAGNIPFTTLFNRTSVDAFTLAEANLASHWHGWVTEAFVGSSSATGIAAAGGPYYLPSSIFPNTNAAGSGAAHGHGIDMRVKYVDCIIAVKD